MRQEWRKFRESEPGTRFIGYHQRVKQASTGTRVLRFVLGLGLLVAGIVMLVIPGPGLVFMVFGLACFAGESRWLAIGMDQAELKARAGWRWLKGKWRGMPALGKALVVTLAVMLAAGTAWGMWRWLGPS